MNPNLMRVVVATSNPGKVKEFQEALSSLNWDLVPLQGVPMPPEDGTTYEENAAIKAATIAMMTGMPALADDSGLEIAALKGEPGVYSARYGNRENDHERNLYLLERARNLTDRRAKFVSVLVLAYPNGTLEEYRGEVEGKLLEGPRGQGGFGYDSLFELPSGRTMAELSLEEKRQQSHRGAAFAQLLEAHRTGRPHH